MWSLLLCLLLYLNQEVAMVTASLGDRSYVYYRCLGACDAVNCTTLKNENYAATQPFYLRWTGWSCFEECGYMCMWNTVDAFIKDGSPIPQFHGKWPFIRVLGMQEPASVIFSILNALPHLIMIIKFRRKVPSSAPLYYVWHANVLVAVNAWFWSTVFHIRDLPFTEMMDYFCAISLVMFNVFILCARVLGTRHWVKLTICSMALLGFFIYHVHYLAFIDFDYGYNMKTTVSVGVLNCLGWLIWCYMVYGKQRYVWKMAVVIGTINLLLVLELGDFPPIVWIFDAHSLWHAGTVLLSFLWYEFAIEDSLYQMEEEDVEQRLPDVKKGL